MTPRVEKLNEHREEEIVLTGSLLPETAEDLVQANRERAIARLHVLWGQRKFLFRFAVVGLLVSTSLAFIIPKRYTSVAHLMPPDQTSGNGMAMLAALAGKAGSSLGSIGSLGSEMLGLKTTGDLFIGILESRTVQDALISKFDLRKIYGDKRWEDARKELGKRTTVSQDRKSEIISIAVSDHSAQRAQQMGEEYIAQLNHVVIDLNTSSAHRERVFLEGRLAQIQNNLESAEKQFSQFASKNTAIDIQEQGKAMITAGATLEGQLIAAQTELEGLKQIYTDSNVRVREVQARVDELRRQLQKLGGKAGGSPPENQDAGTLYPPIRELPLLGVTYADLYRRMKVEEAVFETLTQEYELAKVEEAKETPSVKVLDPPDIPERKSFPPRALIIILGTFLFGLAGIMYVFAEQAWQQTDSADVRKAFATQVWSDTRSAIHSLRVGKNGSHPALDRPASGSGSESESDSSSAKQV